MLKQRAITAVCLMLLLAAVLYTMLLGYTSVFHAFVFLVIGLAAWEWTNLSGISHKLLRAAYVLLVLGGLYVGINQFMLAGKSLNGPVLVKIFNAACVLWAIILLWVCSYPASQIIWNSRAFRLLLGAGVLLPFAMGLMTLANLPQGVAMLVYLMALVAIADSGAYFVGRAIGKHKLAVNVSPGKTWEGFFGGLASALLFALIVWFGGYTFGFSLLGFLAVASACAVVGVLGDLFESMLKRHRGIKDSSQLLPGHGGVLDRIDSHVAAIPVFCLLYFVMYHSAL